VEQALGPLAGRAVLELGAGDGFSTLRLARRGARIIAVELSPAGLHSLAGHALAAGVSASVAPLRADAQQLPLPDQAVDLVYGENFLMYVDPTAIGREASRVLRTGGRAIFLEPTAHHPLIRLYRRFGSPYRGTAPRYFTIDAIATLGANFARVTHEERYLLSVLALPLAGRPFLFALAFRTLDRLDRSIVRRFPQSRRFCWLTVITLTDPRHD
jgi:SAM-dependent methyltransferase